MANQLYDFGMVGLGVMGSNFLLNMADHGFPVIGYDKNPDKTKLFEASAAEGNVVKGVNTVEQFISQMKRPRKVMMLVPAGAVVDSVIADLTPFLEPGDILIDGGNSHYTDTLKRIVSLREKDILFMGIGVSGGEEGARKGPSIMPGGDEVAYKEVAPMLEAVAAKVNGDPCVAYLGKDAAGHYVKMVHNGIEYAIMQLISECYDMLNHGLQYDNAAISRVFSDWNKGELQSYLLEISSEIFKMTDDKVKGKYLVDMILDKAGAKGTGKWTSQEGLDLPVPVPTIDGAVMMRNLSSLTGERQKASSIYGSEFKKLEISPADFEKQLQDAFYFGTLCSYAQGLALLSVASRELKMDIDMPAVVRIWRGGCIIRSELLNNFMEAYKDKDLKNLLLDTDVADLVTQKLDGIRHTVSIAALNNFPSVSLMASLNYFNAYRREFLPTNLIQAQRDFFGAHTYQRVDEEGIFHTEWNTSSDTVSTKPIDTN